MKLMLTTLICFAISLGIAAAGYMETHTPPSDAWVVDKR